VGAFGGLIESLLHDIIHEFLINNGGDDFVPKLQAVRQAASP
jgi:hypothetical protein